MKALPPLLVAAAALLAALPVADNYFYADDFTHLFDLLTLGPWTFVTAPNAGHMYLVRNGMFYLSYLQFGMDPQGYFATVIGTHVVNAVLLWWLLWKLLDAPLVAAAGAIAFAISPTHLGTLGWYSVYGHVLAVTATLLALIAVVARPGDERPLDADGAVGGVVMMLIASQCFGTGAAAAVVFPAMVALLRPESLRQRRTALPLLALPVLVLLAWWVMNATRTQLNPHGAEAAENMIAMVTDYRSVAFMVLQLLGIGVHGLVLGATVPLSRYGGPASIAALGITAVAVGGALVRGSSRARRAMLAFFGGALACYAAVAAGRAALYAAFTGENLLQAFTGATRYQYLSQALLAAGLAVALAELVRAFAWSPRVAQAAFASWAVVALGSAAYFPPHRDDFDTDRPKVELAQQRLARAIERQQSGDACLSIDPAPLAFGFPGTLGVFVLFHDDVFVDGRRVYFVTDDARLLALRSTSRLMHDLLVPKGACPPKPEVTSGVGSPSVFADHATTRVPSA